MEGCFCLLFLTLACPFSHRVTWRVVKSLGVTGSDCVVVIFMYSLELANNMFVPLS